MTKKFEYIYIYMNNYFTKITKQVNLKPRCN